jgi:beta-barrel assembly-enhancing protease
VRRPVARLLVKLCSTAALACSSHALAQSEPAAALPVAASDTSSAMSAAAPRQRYTPQDADERGLWQQVDEFEQKFKNSNFIIRDPALNSYVKDILCKSVGDECQDVRLYIVRNPYFNASMAPNGMMQVWSGLLLRTQDEAQLAAVLGHEFGHYKSLDSLRNFKNIKSKTNTLGWLSVLPIGGLASLGVAVAQFGLVGSIFSFSREMERGADVRSIDYMVAGGYDPTAASQIWEQLRAEADATALARGKKSQKDKNGGIYATHPPSKERMTYLTELAQSKITLGSGTRDRGQDRYHAALKPFWSDFINDQINLNDFGGTELLLGQLAMSGGWTPDLSFARGELYRSRAKGDDLVKAAEFYRAATADPTVTPDAWRGLGLALLRTGNKADGEVALARYLVLKPDASDAGMMRALAGSAVAATQ